LKRKDAERLLDRYRVTDGKGFRLKDHDPADRGGGLVDHDQITALLADGVARLSDLQRRLYAEDSWSVLMVLQAMDAAGKDGTIRHVMTGVNPQGVDVTGFKQPGPEDLAHGFLWRIHKAAPLAGRIAIFNRSHYEDVLVCRVHPALLDHQHLPQACRGKHFWQNRMDDIVNFETYLSHQGTVVLKFFLNLSKEEQKRRFLARIDEPKKNWKFSTADLQERAYWDEYQSAYKDAIKATATEHAPWFVVPADNKNFTHLVVAEALIDALEKLELEDPLPPPEEAERLRMARQKLEEE
jgi:PPK2 family polyphosphate:nucleotide phosphotransferase